MDAVVSQFVTTTLSHYFYNDALELIRVHKKEGRTVVLLSSAVSPLVRCIKEFVGADDFIATKLKSENGRFTGVIDGTMIYGSTKRAVAQEYLKEKGWDIVSVWVYADHHSDIDLLSFADSPNAVNPTRKLERWARKNGCSILRFL